MRAILTTVLLLFASLSHAQFGGVMQTILGAPAPASESIPGPDAISGLAYRFVSSDLQTNANATNWIDRVKGASLTNSTASSPTNTDHGVVFGGTNYLLPSTHNITATSASVKKQTYCLILTLRHSGVDYADIFSVNGGSGYDGAMFIGTRGTDKIYTTDSGALTPEFAFSPGKTIDLVFEASINNPSLGSMMFTNSVQVFSNSLYWANAPCLSGLAYWTAATPTRRSVFDLYELMIFTNWLGASDIAALHRYATNAYNFSP